MATEPRADIVICGGGSSGAALAGILARDTDASVLLLEGGPDYGALADGGWPAELLDARRIPRTHPWGHSGTVHASKKAITNFDRAKVIGGCSSHNGCIALLGHREDYDEWATLGNPGWDWDSVAPAFARAIEQLAVNIPPDEDIAPYHLAFIEAAVEAGVPRSADMNDPDEPAGVAAAPVNVVNGVRNNSALAYLDPQRHRPNLTIIGNALVDKVELDGTRAVAVQAIIDGIPQRIAAGKIVLAAGAYGTPEILLRSGIGPSDELNRHNLATLHHLPGVGECLNDHPALTLTYTPSDKLLAASAEFATTKWLPDEQALAKIRSHHADSAFDLHLYTVGTNRQTREGDDYELAVSTINPRSTGTVRLRSLRPDDIAIVDHNYFSDPDGHDREVLLDGIEIAREIMANVQRAGWIVGEYGPATDITVRTDLSRFLEEYIGIYYHPACSCHMGPDSDPLAVVDHTGKVHGLEGLSICDASIFPTLMRANTNLPAVMVAEHLAQTIGRD